MNTPDEHKDKRTDDDATRVVAVPRAKAGADETVALARDDVPAARDDVPAARDEAPPAPRQAAAAPEHDSTVVSERPTRNPAPPVPDPEREALPPGMFKSPLSTRYRVPKAPTQAPEHALPRKGVAQGLPVVSATRAGRRDPARRRRVSEELGDAPQYTPLPAPAERESLRSLSRVNRRFALITVTGFALSVVVCGLGLWGVSVLLWG